jgi:phosphate transport system substrate-binding protein
MQALVMKGTPMIQALDMIIETMMGAVNAVGRDPLGVGYSVYYYATFMLPDKNVKLVSVNGVKPTSEDIATRAYPLTTEVYAVMRKGIQHANTATILRDWLFTEEGRAAIVESGYVPISVR